MRRRSTKNAWPLIESFPKPQTQPTNDMSFEDMLLRSKEILNREINHLMLSSGEGKLDPDSAKDLVQYMKILKDLTKQEAEQAESLSEEQLKAALANKEEKE